MAAFRPYGDNHRPTTGAGMQARYDSGDCTHCGKPIIAGQYFSWARRGNTANTAAGKWHANCESPWTSPRSNNATQYSQVPATLVPVAPPPAPPPVNTLTVTHNNAGDITSAIAAVAGTLREHSEAIGTLANAMTTLQAQSQEHANDVTNRLDNTDALFADLAQQVNELRPINVVFTQSNHTIVREVGVQHEQFMTLLEWLKIGSNVMLVGPAGSGKSTAAKKIAELLDLNYEEQGIALSAYDLIGNKDGHGVYQETPIYRAWTRPSLLLLDEMDRWEPKALLRINNGLANGIIDFPVGQRVKCEETLIVASLNTYGFGSKGAYVANKLDGSSRDRFVKIEWNYDNKFERALIGRTGNDHIDALTDEWVTLVQNARAAVTASGTEGIVISPRASLTGAKAIRSGLLTNEKIVSGVFGDLRRPEICSIWPTIGADIEAFARRTSVTATNVTTAAPTVNLSTVTI